MTDADKIGELVASLLSNNKTLSEFTYEIYKLGWNSGKEKTIKAASKVIDAQGDKLKSDLSILLYKCMRP